MLTVIARGYGRPPAGYGHHSPRFAAPRAWWDGTRPQARNLNLHCLFIPPWGQLHTAFSRHACFPMAQALLSLGVTMGTHSSRGAVGRRPY